jgi:two-component system sensor histidine kinase CpxA
LWAVTVLTIGGALVLTWIVMSERPENRSEDSRAMFLTAAQTLDAGGEEALVNWLREIGSRPEAPRVLIVGPSGQELLGRPLPPSIAFALRYPDGGIGESSPLRILPAQPLPLIISRDGRRYAISVRPVRPRYQPNFMFLPIEDRWIVLLLAVFVTTVISFLLARSIARPMRTLAQATRQLAAGALGTRVGQSIDSRAVEVVGLARDFDAMAARIELLVQSRDQLLRDVSHELRSPLARMRVALGLARQSTADVPGALERLDTEVDRLDRLIGQVLNLARLDSTAISAASISVDLVELIDNIVRDAAFEGQARAVTIQWQSPEIPCTVSGQPEWLASAIENVVRNALRYTRDGSSLDLALHQDGETATVSVADHGPGVPEKDLVRIFEPFYRVASARGRDSGGDGIGLAIVARVLQLHGGRATAENRPGGGLVVRLTLPLRSENRTVNASA